MGTQQWWYLWCTSCYLCSDVGIVELISIRSTVFMPILWMAGNVSVIWSSHDLFDSLSYAAETLEAVLNDCRYLNATSEDPSKFGRVNLEMHFFFFFVHPLIRWPIAVADDPPNCPALNKSINMDITYSCRLQTPIVNEAVGEHALLQYLPGCNALWSGNTSKPPCPSGHIDGGDLDLVSPSVWYREEPYISPWPEFKKSSQWWGIFDIFIIFTTRFIKCSALIYLDKS